jgi:uncharacterized peroxidase-related enzyme
VAAIAEDWRTAPVDERQRALLEYADRLTRDPAAMRSSDVQTLRDAGWPDEAILHACEVVAYFNFVNRLADGLGVRLEVGWREPIVGTARPHPDEE